MTNNERYEALAEEKRQLHLAWSKADKKEKRLINKAIEQVTREMGKVLNSEHGNIEDFDLNRFDCI